MRARVRLASPSPMALKFDGVFSVGDVATLHPNRAHGEAPSFFYLLLHDCYSLTESLEVVSSPSLGDLPCRVIFSSSEEQSGRGMMLRAQFCPMM